MASLLTASRQDPAATRGLHARTETVRFGAAAFARLKCALWQSNPPLFFTLGDTKVLQDVCFAQAASAAESELSSLLVHGGRVKKASKKVSLRVSDGLVPAAPTKAALPRRCCL